MKSRTILATLTAGGLLLATAGLAQTTSGGSAGATDPSKSGQSTTQQVSGTQTQPSMPSGSGQTGTGSGTGMQSGSGTGSGQTGAGSAAQQPSMQSGSGQAGAGAGAQQGSGMAMDKEKVRQLQEALKSQGHDPGPVDGIMGPKTQAALQEYQKAENLQSRAEALQKLGVNQ